MIPIKINGKKYQIPGRWEEITYLQYEKYMKLKNPDVYALVSVFTGVPRDRWVKSKEVQGFYIILNALSFISKKPKFKYRCPTFVKIENVDYEVPKEIDKHTVMQYEDMRALLQMHLKSNKNEIKPDLYPSIIAVYFAPLLFGEYDAANWEKTIPLIKTLPFGEVMGMGDFFLKNFIELRTGTPGYVRKWFMIPRNYKRVLRRLGSGAFSIF